MVGHTTKRKSDTKNSGNQQGKQKIKWIKRKRIQAGNENWIWTDKN